MNDADQAGPGRDLPPAEVLAAAVDQLAGELGNLRASLAVTAAERDRYAAALADVTGPAD